MINFLPIPSSIEELPTGIYLLAKIKGADTVYEVAAHRQGGLVWEVDHTVIPAKRFTFYAYIDEPRCKNCTWHDDLKRCIKNRTPNNGGMSTCEQFHRRFQ